MGRKRAAAGLIALMIGASGCGDDGSSTETQASPSSTMTDQRPLFGKCSSGEAAGVDGLTCEDADQLLASWSRQQKQIDATLKRCHGPTTAGHDHFASDGIDCGIVDDLIANAFAPHPPGWVERRAGITCRIVDGETGLRVTCQRDGSWFTFMFS
jgi:hypothetical protein